MQQMDTPDEALSISKDTLIFASYQCSYFLYPLSYWQSVHCQLKAAYSVTMNIFRKILFSF